MSIALTCCGDAEENEGESEESGTEQVSRYADKLDLL
jgi:hypothetical protein